MPPSVDVFTLDPSEALRREAGLREVRARLKAGVGPLTVSARANAVSGVP